MRYRLICVGKVKSNSPEAELIAMYTSRLKGSFKVDEIDIKNIKNPNELNLRENQKIQSLITPTDFTIGLDKDGKVFSSEDFSNFLHNKRVEGHQNITFVIGGASGLDETSKKMCSTLLSFGKQTWPHMLARVMLFEQIYRAQCIIDGHPYHK